MLYITIGEPYMYFDYISIFGVFNDMDPQGYILWMFMVDISLIHLWFLLLGSLR